MGTEFVGSPVPLSLTGATSATRYVGGTASVAPVAGTFAVGDFVVTQTGAVYVCTVAGTPGTWANVADSAASAGFEIGYTQITSNANITDTSEATATALITSAALTFDGAPVICEFFSARVQTDSNAIGDTTTITLFEGATQITRLAVVDTTAAQLNVETVCARYRFTPTAAVHTYKVCAFVPSTTGTPSIGAGAGGTGALPPAYLRFTKV